MPVKGSYLIPKSMCSWIPNPKQPVSEKFCFLSYLSLTLSPLSKISSALSPLTVTCTAIFSFLLIPKLLMVYLALEGTGFWPVRSSKTFEADIILNFTFCQLITRFSDTDVDDDLLYFNLSHGVFFLSFSHTFDLVIII